MGREIKFRVWDKELKKMHVCGENVHDSITFGEDGKAYYYNLQNGEGSGEHGDYMMMQYTGLKDEEETEIYDGDLCTDDGVTVLQVLWVESHHQWGVKVLKGSGTLSLGLTFPLWHWDDCKQNGYRKLKIIGNAFENPELIEV